MKKIPKLAIAALVAGTSLLTSLQAYGWWGGNRYRDDYWYDRHYDRYGPYGWGGSPYGWGGGPYGWGGPWGGWGGYPGYGYGYPYGGAPGTGNQSAPPPRPE